MRDEPAGPATAQDKLDEWLEGMNPVLARLEFFTRPAGIELDYTPGSLAQLEAFASERWPDGRVVFPFHEAATAYVGEVLLRAAGGHWDWDSHADLPIVRPDPALDLAPLSPAQLVAAAAHRHTGTELATAHAALLDAVHAHTANHPGWTPTKQHTPGVDEITHLGPVPAPPWLDQWLAGRAANFDAWAADTGIAPERWDFSPATLTTLDAVIKKRFQSRDDLTRPESRAFVDGAVWYCGEVARRNKARTQWRYNPADADTIAILGPPERNPLVGRPFIDQDGPGLNRWIPSTTLELVLIEDHEPSWLIVAYDRLD
ncbi:hypothetical protein ACNTMW_18315 [Planosporangium sp. 12N6]|uniref:hypothetical protein n=1 Tax=Planosporangium spinosum TaxID=3402278 RepID=UPI003CE96871